MTAAGEIAWGTDQTYPHMAVPWTWAFDTPFSWTKQIASHFGGTRQGMAISWPKVITDKGGISNQFHHMIDIVPTILKATGLRAPDVVDGIKQSPIEGVSMAYTPSRPRGYPSGSTDDVGSPRKPRYVLSSPTFLPRRLSTRNGLICL